MGVSQRKSGGNVGNRLRNGAREATEKLTVAMFAGAPITSQIAEQTALTG
jgi:hypothetical protein